jgi:hypothetical protein
VPCGWRRTGGVQIAETAADTCEDTTPGVVNLRPGPLTPRTTEAVSGGTSGGFISALVGSISTGRCNISSATSGTRTGTLDSGIHAGSTLLRAALVSALAGCRIVLARSRGGSRAALHGGAPPRTVHTASVSTVLPLPPSPPSANNTSTRTL